MKLNPVISPTGGNIEQIDDILGLLGRANLETLLEMLLRDFAERPPQIGRAAADGDRLVVERGSHLLLGSARYIGAATMVDTLMSIEAAARGGTIAHDAVAAMIDEAARLHADILAWRLAHPV